MSVIEESANMNEFERVAEVDVDSRRRISLGKIARHTRYAIEVSEVGEILLLPMVSMTVRDVDMLSNPELLKELRQAVRDSDALEKVPLGDLIQELGLTEEETTG